MLRAIASFLVGLSAAACYGQQSINSSQPSTGLENPWDVQTVLKKIATDNADLKMLFSTLHPQQWAAQKGAPTTYILQLQSAQQQERDIATVSSQLAAKTDDLALALDEYFRLESLDVATRNLEEGARRYADRAAADKLAELIARNFNDREQFRQYLKDLASSIQQNFKIADSEAQRCRGMISREPAATARKSHK